MYPLTPGQFDAVFGTYGRAFMNAHVLAVTLVIDEPVNRHRLTDALTELRRRHPALRARLDASEEAENCRQIVAPADRDMAEPMIHVVAEEADPDRLADLLSAGLAQLARDFDVVEGRTWGVVLAHSASVSYLVLAFAHFASDLLSVMMLGREFAHLYNGDADSGSGSGDDGYGTYLSEIAAARKSTGRNPDVEWWLCQPWGDMPAVPELSDIPVAEQDWTERTESICRTTRLTELEVIAAVGRSLRDVCGLPWTRIDVAGHGRLTRARWSTVGCIARVMPYFIDWQRDPAGMTQQLDEIKTHEPAWDAAFPAVRRLTEVPVEQQLGAHAFVNFHGSIDATRYATPPFSLSPVQPMISRPPRFPFTPFRLTVRRTGPRWTLSWRHNAFIDDELPATAIAQTTALLNHG